MSPGNNTDDRTPHTVSNSSMLEVNLAQVKVPSVRLFVKYPKDYTPCNYNTTIITPTVAPRHRNQRPQLFRFQRIFLRL